jgi:predicted DNA-binding transcriptional regulator YafY
VRAVVRVSRPASYGLRAQFGTTAVIIGELDDGRVEVEIGAPSASMIAERVAGWGDAAEIVSPDDVRAELARIGEGLVARYA